LAVWDGHPGDGPSGTEAQIRVWQAAGFDVDVVDLTAITRSTGLLRPGGEGHPVPAPETADPPDFQQRVMAMLFADAVGYSQLNEEQIPIFVREFLGSVAHLLDRSPHKPVMKNTWGDAVFFVFEGIENAGALALDLRDRIRGTDWVAHGLPERMNLRIALHAGPVYGFTDPVTAHPNFSGTHVSMAARIEPITPPGEVYCSEPFAVLAATRGVTAFACDHVGRTPLAKKYGIFPTYHLRRT
ncbi:MAG: adenylate/guanylate cyclase domain-containing protein, partial [Candidatus Sericytochromatia bacterium]|nr:adenylate/guanylate cyclase domain-containing protein [Candidatus Tanganyikabacteria bacterium]